jgi:DNA polymerase IIIc chi subunit
VIEKWEQVRGGSSRKKKSGFGQPVSITKHGQLALQRKEHMLFNGKSRPEIIDYARRRLDEGVDQATVTEELMERWPYEINDSGIADSVIVFAKQALRS